MECVAWAAKQARRAEEEQDTSENSDEDEVDQDMENDDGSLPEAEKEVLRKMVLVDVLGHQFQETGNEEVLGRAAVKNTLARTRLRALPR